MPPAFILSHDQTLKFMTNIIAVEFHDNVSISRSCSAHILTYGYVKDMYKSDLALNDPTSLEDPKDRVAAAHMSLHLKPTMSKSAEYRRLVTPFFQRANRAPKIW